MNPLRTVIQYATAPFRWIVTGPARMIGLPRRLLGLSAAARVALLLFVSLTLITVGVAVYLRYQGDQSEFWSRYGPGEIALGALVLIALPIAAYYLVRLWIEGDVSRFPDIDKAWSAGLAALADEGIDPTELPLYLVVGVSDEALLRRTMRASGVDLAVEGMPRGAAPIRWFASQDAIYLTIEGAGWTGKLDPGAQAPGQESPVATARFQATMVVGSSAMEESAEAPAAVAPAAPSAPIYGTLILDEETEESAGAAPAAPKRPAAVRRWNEEDLERLRYVAGRLRRARQPYCANNGILLLLPVHVLEEILIAKDAPQAVRADISAISEATRLVSPVTLCVVGLEAEGGLHELVTRVGADRAAGSRFGKRFDVWNEASGENLDALSAHACGAFEDWVYQLFRDDLQEPGNKRLYSMLSRVRSRLRARLRSVLVQGLANDGDDPSDEDPMLFGGCYFAATGEHSQQQAFVRSVFDRVSELSNHLQWRASAIREDAACRTAAQVLMVVSLGLLGVAGWLVTKLF